MTLINAPKIIVFAGPNGSGKSTVTQAWEKAGLYINADDIKQIRPNHYWTVEAIEKLIAV